ncbi:MAG: hypothetical protein ACYDC6_03165 [Acidobacteriaceae bacterium]
MNSEQLNSARLARWSQNGEARLTQEAAAEWLSTLGFCPYLPIGPSGAAPTASFLEAVVGRPAETPSAGEQARALEILARLIENSSAVPLKFGNLLGEQPDFVASEEVFRYIYALRGDRNFKNGPSTVGNEKVTTLAQHCWQAIEQHGPMDMAALQPVLGRDITEAAIARALQELWTGLYAFPILSAKGAPAQWELLSRRFSQQVAAGASTGQAESLSAMISLYLHAVVAAVEEDILAFLSPLASQSKLREVVRGLGSMRQLDIIDVAGRSHVCLQGGLLPEMVAQLSEEQLTAAPMRPEIEIEAASAEQPRASRFDSDEPKKFAPKKFVPKQFVSGKFAAAEGPGPKRFAVRASGDRTSAGTGGFSRGRSGERTGPRPGGRSGPGGSSRFSGSRPGAPTSSRPGSRPAGNYPPRPRSNDEGAPSYRKAPREDAARPSTRGLGERAKRWEKSGEVAGERPTERKSFPPRSPGPKPFAFKKPAGFKKSGFKPGGAKPWASKGAGSRAGSSSGEGARKPWTSRPASGAGASRFSSPERGDREGGERPKRWDKPSAGSASGPTAGKPYASKGKPSGYTASGFKSAGSRSAESKSFGAKPAGAKPWASKGAASRVGSARSYAARTGDDAAPRSGAKPWAKRASSGSGEAGDHPKRRERTAAPAGERGGTKPFWAKNPRGGKGSTAASRTNRAKPGSKGGKKAGKKK